MTSRTISERGKKDGIVLFKMRGIDSNISGTIIHFCLLKHSSYLLLYLVQQYMKIILEIDLTNKKSIIRILRKYISYKWF